jgi:four helix bundle protein
VSVSVQTFKDLIVWQKAMDLVPRVYAATREWPREEAYGLTSQIRRCAVSIPSNIAEGYGRGSTQDYLRFLHIARGSLYEFETQAEIARRLGYLADEEHARMDEAAREVYRILGALISKLSERTK